jgi:hypothetical protein
MSEDNRDLSLEADGRARRREAFLRVKQGVVALAYLRTDLQQLRGAPVRELNKHIKILGSAFVVDDAGIAATAYHVITRHFQRVAEAKKSGGAPPPPLYWLSHSAFVGNPDEGRALFMVNQVLDGMGSAENDLALVQLAPLDGLIPRPLKLSSELCEEGDELAVCGWPFGLELHHDRHKGAVLTASFAPAMVSAVLPSPRAPQRYRDIIQIATWISGGNSGGPLFDPVTGDVLGIVLSGVETGNEFRAEVPVRNPQTDAIEGWRLDELSLDIPSGLARAGPIHLLAPRIPQFIKQIQEKAARQSATQAGAASSPAVTRDIPGV